MILECLIVLTLASPALCQNELLVWGFECKDDKCVKVLLKGESEAQGQMVCRMLCGDDIGTLWPKPRGRVNKGTHTIQLNRSKIKFQRPPNLNIEKLWRTLEVRFRGQINNKIPEPSLLPNIGQQLLIKISVDEAPTKPKLTYDTDESYYLRISQDEYQVLAEISGKTFFGVRHGLESLSQLIVYDEIRDSIQIIADTEIFDAPAYKHRGLQLDTGRNYFSVKSIKRTINGMAMSKLNVLHWHITDSASFPLVVRSRPEFHNLGAYSARKIYTREHIADILEYALARGVRVIPEFNAPGRVGEGWQNTNLTVCFNAKPWRKYCWIPPCNGQLDPSNGKVYDALEDIYREIFEAFDPDVFHMGVDQVTFTCWNHSESIRNWMHATGYEIDYDNYVRLVGYFQKRAQQIVDKVSKNSNVSIIVSEKFLGFAPFFDEFLDKSRYIVQTLQGKPSAEILKNLKNYIRMIGSPMELHIKDDTDSWLGGWNDVRGWQKFYDHDPIKLYGGPNKLILGSEAILNSDKVDEFSLDLFLWPKVSALGERLWTSPDHGWQKAESRLIMHRTLLTENGLAAAATQPEWCFINNNECRKFAYD